jgi:hypothetical protein
MDRWRLTRRIRAVRRAGRQRSRARRFAIGWRAGFELWGALVALVS